MIMKNLKLSLKKEIISKLEAKNVVGGVDLTSRCKNSFIKCITDIACVPPPYSENCFTEVPANCEFN